MSTWAVVGVCVACFYLGGALGFWLCRWLRTRADYDGVIEIVKEDEKILYSLILNEDPEVLQVMDEVIFKVKPAVDIRK